MKLKHVLSVILILSLLLSIGCSASRKEGDDPSAFGLPRDRSLEDDSFATTSYTDTCVGSYEEERHGVTFRVDFWSVPRPLLGERIEGTLTYANNTDEKIEHYLHAFIDLVGPFYYGELPYSTSPVVEPNEEYTTVTEERPIFVSLDSGEAITVNFSVGVPTEFEEPERSHFLTFGLSETETFNYNDALCDFYFLVT